MKWNHNGVTYRRGCYEGLIARYDGKGAWFCNRGLMTQQTMKACFKRLGEYLGASSVEVKPMWNEDDDCTTETNIVVVDRMSDGSYKVYREPQEGEHWEPVPFEEAMKQEETV